MAEGSQTFEQALAKLVVDGLVTREEALSYADSPTNLMWRMDNELFQAKKDKANEETDVLLPGDDDMPSFTEITLDIKPL